MDSIFKTGQEVWFTWELDGKSHESFGTIDEVYYFNDVRKHKYKITSFSQLKQKAFYIWEDKISFYKKEDRDELRCVDCKYNKDVISIGRCDSCACSHRLFEKKLSYSIKKLEEAYSKAEAMCDNSEPRKVCKTCKNRECSLAYVPCRICKDHDRWEPTGGYIYPVGARVRFIFNEKELIGLIQERRLDHRYRISVKGKFYVVTPDSILGYAAKWIDDPSIRKAFGLDIKNDILKEDNKMKKEQKKRNRNIIKTEKSQRTIKDITFNGPAVIVKFEPSEEDLVWGRFKGDKVVVVCKNNDKYDMKTGFLLAILKEFLNNQSYGNILEKLDSFDALDIPQVGKDEVRK